MRIVGVDPGIAGGFFLLEDKVPETWSVMPVIKEEAGFAKVAGRLKRDKDGNKIKRYRTSVDARAVVLLLRDMSPDYAFIERVHAMPGQGVTSMFSFGQSLGILKGAFASLDGLRELRIVGPKEWQKVMFKGIPVSDTKQVAAKVTYKLWPGLDLRKSKRARKPHDGICDAACIAEYGRRQLAEGSAV